MRTSGRLPLSSLFAAPACAIAFAGFGAAFAAEPAMSTHQPDIDKIVAEISPQRIESYVRKLASFHTRHTMSETASDTHGIGAARRWIKSELERCNAQSGNRLQIAFDGYTEPAGPRLSRPTEIVDVVATLAGTQPESHDRIYVVSGHYDSRATDVMDSASAAPGVDDDASGTAAVMEMACVMARHRFDATLVFLAVAGEEQGLFGSAHFAEEAKQKQWNVAGMFTNDIIGSSRADDGHVDRSQVRLFAEGIPPVKEVPDKLRTLISTGGESDSISRQLARHVKEIGERYVPNFKVTVVQRRDRYLRGGDHIPFLERGFAALRFTEPNEDFRHQHQDVRAESGTQYGDLPEFVDYDYTAQVARVNAAALASLALAPAAPQNVGVEIAQLENDTTLRWDAGHEPDLTGYRIVWRDTTAPQWQGGVWVGMVTRYTVKGLSKDNVFFGVQAVDKDGNASPAAYPSPAR
jgi:hypothetical protein